MATNQKRVLTEEELGERDLKIAKDLTYVITHNRSLAEQMRRDATELEKQARFIEQEVRAVRWFNLSGYLEDDEIESLCEVSPVNLLETCQGGVS